MNLREEFVVVDYLKENVKFKMIVEEVHSQKKNLIVTGNVELGELVLNDSIKVLSDDGDFDIYNVIGMRIGMMMVNKIKQGDRAEILLKDVGTNAIIKGDILVNDGDCHF